MNDFRNFLNMSPAEREAFWQKQPPDKTSTLLVEHLAAKPWSPERDHLIERAKAFEFDDFKSGHATPKILLNAELMKLGHADLAENVRRGLYD